MRLLRSHILVIVFLALLSPVAQSQEVMKVNIDGSVNPVTAQFLGEAIQEASKRKAACLILHLNTPGGLLKSTRLMVSHILESEVPVVVYVSPGGAHAGSAGVFIVLASHVAAMAPGTNMGSAHPVSGQGGITDSIMNEKATNDAAAFIRSIAEKRNRNLEWAEDAVRFSVSISENEALNKNIIDLVAKNDQDLLTQLNGREVTLASGKTVALSTSNANISEYSMTWIQKLLNLISDPNVAYVLMLLGIYGLIFEFYSPGIGFPGIVGGISLILAFYAMHTLPLNYAGLALIGFGIALFVAEMVTPAHGLLGVGAVVALLLGSLFLIKPGSSMEWAKISLGVIIAGTATSGLFFLLVAAIGLRAQRAKVVTGVEALIGDTALTIEPLNPKGRVVLHGESWNAMAVSGNIEANAKVRVKGVTGLVLEVDTIDQT